MGRDYEQEASGMGWVPQEEWKGNPDQWRPAEDFVKRGEEILPIVNKHNKELKQELATLKDDVAMIAKVTKQQVVDAEQAGYDKAKAEYEGRLEALQKQKFDAVQEGDLEAFQKAEGDIANLNQPEPPKKDEPAAQPQVNPVFEDWSKQNTWYIPDPANPGDGGDQDLTAFAEGFGRQIAAQHDLNSPEGMEKFYTAIGEKVKATFPQKFENPNRNEPGMTQPGSTGPSRKQKKTTWADLPDSAKQAFGRQEQMMKNKGFEFTKEQYLKIYNEEG